MEESPKPKKKRSKLLKTNLNKHCCTTSLPYGYGDPYNSGVFCNISAVFGTT